MRDTSTALRDSLEPAHAPSYQVEAPTRPLNVLVLGGDGFCGWATSLHLSANGHDVTIVDNLSRRNIDNELGTESLTPIRPIDERLEAWRAQTGRHIGFHRIDVATDYYELSHLLLTGNFDGVVHFAEQRAAPYSMKSPWHRRYTIDNNIRGTNNLLTACSELDDPPHIVHLGTAGRFGYSSAGGVIPEGYFKVQVIENDGPSYVDEIPYPYRPGSLYHTGKCLDEVLFHFYAKNDGLRITDLAQGIVWGTQTDETRLDPRLVNRFDYCGDYGTVLNRFLAQAAIGYPLTVHGTGGQTRAFIHIRDTCRCIEIALANPPAHGERVKILNQMTECHRVRDLAAMVAGMTGAEIAYTPNPRKEDAENELMVANDSLLALGLEPTTLTSGLMDEVREVAEKYAHRVDRSKIPCYSTWTREQKAGVPC